MRRSQVTIRELESRQDWTAAYPLVVQSNPKMTRRQFDALLAEMLKANYRCIGAYIGGRLVGITGLWVGTRFWCGPYMDVDNVVVDEKHRNKGIGTAMMKWAEKEARKLKCKIIVLDSYTHFHDAHRFYFREGYIIRGYHFTKDL